MFSVCSAQRFDWCSDTTCGRREGLVVFALVCGRNVRLLSEQIKAWRPRYVSVQDENARQSLLLLLDAESKYRAMPEDKVALIAETSDILYNQKADQSLCFSFLHLLISDYRDGKKGAVLAASLTKVDTVIGAITGLPGLSRCLPLRTVVKRLRLPIKRARSSR